MQGSVRKRGSMWSYSFDMGTVGGKRQRKEKGGFRTKKEAEAALARTSEARAIPTAEYGSIPRKATNIGVMTAAALIPAKPVPRPAPIPAIKQIMNL